MELSKHANHRNSQYLNWLRKQQCVVSGEPAQCAHHVRLGTNGGSSLKPSDYFCIPLKHEFHTLGAQALHLIGEETFLTSFHLNPKELFIFFLKKYALEMYDLHIQVRDASLEKIISILIEMIESKGPTFDSPPRKSKKKKSITDNPHYLKAKEAKNKRDKETRDSMKPLKESEYYIKAKEEKKTIEKEMRDKNKLLISKYRKEQYQKLKQQKAHK